MMKTISVAALLMTTATASFAGALETKYEDEVIAPLPVAGSGIGAPAIIAGVVGAAALAALIANNDDDGDSVSDHPVAD